MKKIGVEQIRGHQAAAKEHGDQKQRRERLAQGESLIRERIGQHGRAHQHDERAAERIQNGVEIVLQNFRAAEQRFVRLQRKAVGQQPHLAGIHHRRVADGGG